MKYTKNDGQLLSSALKHNLKIANQIVEDVQGGVNHLLNLLESGALSGKTSPPKAERISANNQDGTPNF